MSEGYQVDELAGAEAVMATAKHFAGDGLSESGRDYNAVDASPYRMHNVVLPPFKAAVDAGVGAVMVGFQDLAGVPCTAHRELLPALPRDRWGFAGRFVPGSPAILELVPPGVAAEGREHGVDGKEWSGGVG